MARPLINTNATFKSGWKVLEKWLDDVDRSVYQAIGTGVGVGTAPRSHADVRRNLGVSQVVDVTHYGAVGDGVTDDTVAIQAAVDAADFIHFPAGTYLISTVISITVALGKSKVLAGDGKRSSILKFSGAIDGLDCSFVSQQAAHLYLRDIKLLGSSSGLNLLTLDNASRVFLDNVEFRDAGQSSITSDGSCILIQCLNCNFEAFKVAAWRVVTGLTALAKFDTCEFNYNNSITPDATSAAILVESGAAMTWPTFVNTNMNGGSAIGSFIRVAGGLTSAELINAYVEFVELPCVQAVGSGEVGLLGVRGGHFHCSTNSNSSTIDLNNGVAHFSIKIDKIRQTASSGVACVDFGSATDWSYTLGSKESGTQHIVGETAGVNNISSKGYAFPATPVGPGGSGHLDVYKASTWTPTLLPTGTQPTGVTYTTQIGEYVKIGRLVMLTGRVTLSSKGTGGTGNMTIKGLPFAPNTTYLGSAVVSLASGWTTKFPTAGYVQGSTIRLVITDSAATSNDNIDWSTNATDTSSVTFAITYYAGS